jgi:hypothetical protein
MNTLTQPIPNPNNQNVDSYTSGEIDESSLNLETPPLIPKQTGLVLELGDIIEIDAENSDINEQVFYVMYIDSEHIKLFNIATRTIVSIHIQPDGQLSDESIRVISLLNRSNEKGYARQNGLFPKVWVDIHFGGEIPTIITGEISNLEEDMIELITYPDLDIIYIDFGYKGIPKDIPIDKIMIRDKPSSLSQTSLTTARSDIENEENWEEHASIEYTDSGESVIYIPEGAKPDKNIREILHSMYVQANDLIIEELGEIVQYEEVPEHQKRFSIETQISDLTDQLLSKIPDSNRTSSVLNNIHHLTNRFVQLREEFSRFDNTGNIVSTKLVGKLKKPIVDKILELDQNLRWLMPVVVHRRKVYLDNTTTQYLDIDNRVQIDDIRDLYNAQREFTAKNTISEDNKYGRMMNQIHGNLVPFVSPKLEEFPNLLMVNQRVNVALEGIVSNLENFASSIALKGEIAKRKFILQRYNLGEQRKADQILRSGRKVSVTQQITLNDEICIQSILMFPRAVVEYSKTQLPSTSILKRTQYAFNPFMTSMALKSMSSVHTHTVEDLNKEIEYNPDDTSFLTKIQHYMLDENVQVTGPNIMKQFLNVVFPKTLSYLKLLRKYIKHKFSLIDVAKELEPFGITLKELTFSHYLDIRYFVKEQIAEYRKKLAAKTTEFLTFVSTRFDVFPPSNRIGDIFKERPEMLEWMKDAYRYNKSENDIHRDFWSSATSSEILNDMYNRDGAQLYSKIVSYLLLSLITPDKLLSGLTAPNIEDMTDAERMKAQECNLRILTKKYTSVGQLQKDNNTDEVFYDKEYDDTPYDILSKYKNEKKSKPSELFLEFFKEVLISKHDCPEYIAAELAQTIIRGKKMVKEGEYAVLVIRPTLPPNEDLSELSRKQRDEVERESELRTKTQYFKRISDNWVHDDSVNEETFIDNNKIFCNLDQKCSYTDSELVDKCLPMNISELKRKALSQNRIMKELGTRYEMSIDQIEQSLSDTISLLRRHIRNSIVFRESLMYKQNNICVTLGKQLIRPDEEIVESPYLKLRDLILSQDEFVKKQHDIVRFVDTFTRAPLLDLNEHESWMYCKQTNTKLFPINHYDLAKMFCHNPENYQTLLERVCNESGKKIDNLIVDKSSGWVLKQMDLEVEEEYDESGFKQKSHDIIESELSSMILESISKKKKMFESPDLQKVYNIFSILATNIGLKTDALSGGIEEFVLRVSSELINNTNAVVISSESAYNKRLEKEKEKKDKKMAPYEMYRDELIVIITSAVTLVAVQSMIPSFKTGVTFPGCVQSFGGYPIESGMENTSGIKYIACILEKIKGKQSSVWKSVFTIKAEGFEKRMLRIIQDFLMTRHEIQNLYILKREYLLIHPVEVIPFDANVATKWRQFQPPIMHTNMSRNLQGISTDYESELMNALQNGNKSQHEMISVLKTKLLKHAYAVVETINHVVSTKESLFLTASKNPYLQNACCNEDPKKIQPIQYFIEENANINVFIQKSIKMAALLHKVNTISRGDLLYHEPSTANVYPTLPTGFELKSIYEAYIHYCKFDSNIPIPTDLIPVCNEKPREYNRKWSIEEKMDFLKRNNKNYGVDSLHQLMMVIQRRNLLPPIYTREISVINKFKDVLESLELKNSMVIQRELREKIWDVLGHYSPHVMVSDGVENELNESIRLLNKELDYNNVQLLDEILDFLRRHSGLSTAEYNKMEKFISEINVWKLDDARKTDSTEYTIYTVLQYIKNEVFMMSKIAPSIILNSGEFTTIPKHWNLSNLHKRDIHGFVNPQAVRFNKYKKNKSVELLLKHIQPRLVDVFLFMDNLPIFAPIYKNKMVFYSLFSPETIYLFIKYCWYSVLYEHIVASRNEDLIQIEIRETGQIRPVTTTSNEESMDLLLALLNEDVAVAPPNLQEVQISAGNKQELYKNVAGLLVTYLKSAVTNKKMIDIPYAQITQGVNITQMGEKKKITDMFEDMDKDQRRMEYTMKQLKMGDRWSEGLKKSIFEYDKDAYDRSREETHQYFVSDLNNFGIEIENVNIITSSANQQTVEELNAEDEETAAVNDEEGNDISGLHSGFMDGQVYTSDYDEDDIFGED